MKIQYDWRFTINFGLGGENCDTYLQSQHSQGLGRRVASLRSAWFTPRHTQTLPHIYLSIDVCMYLKTLSQPLLSPKVIIYVYQLQSISIQICKGLLKSPGYMNELVSQGQFCFAASSVSPFSFPLFSSSLKSGNDKRGESLSGRRSSLFWYSRHDFITSVSHRDTLLLRRLAQQQAPSILQCPLMMVTLYLETVQSPLNDVFKVSLAPRVNAPPHKCRGLGYLDSNQI